MAHELSDRADPSSRGSSWPAEARHDVARPRSDSRQAAHAAGFLTLAGLVTGGGNLIFHVIVARRGGAVAYGVVGALLPLATIAGFLQLGSSYAIARMVVVSDGMASGRMLLLRASAALWPWLLVSALLFGLVFPLSDYLKLGSLAPAFVVVVLFAATVGSAAPLGVMVGLKHLHALATLNMASPVVRISLGVVLASGSAAATGAMAASLIPTLAIATIAVLLVLRSPRAHVLTEGVATPTRVPTGRGGLMAEGMIGALLAAGLWEVWSMPLLFGRHYLSPVISGDLAAAQLLTSGILFLSNPFVTAFFPTIVRNPARRTMAVGFCGILAVASVGTVGLVAVGPPVMKHLYGQQFGATRTVFLALGVSVIAAACSSYALWMTRALGRHVALTGVAVAVALVFEATLGSTWHRSAASLAIGPALALSLGVVVALGLARAEARRHEVRAPSLSAELRSLALTGQLAPIAVATVPPLLDEVVGD